MARFFRKKRESIPELDVDRAAEPLPPDTEPPLAGAQPMSLLDAAVKIQEDALDARLSEHFQPPPPTDD